MVCHRDYFPGSLAPLLDPETATACLSNFKQAWGAFLAAAEVQQPRVKARPIATSVEDGGLGITVRPIAVMCGSLEGFILCQLRLRLAVFSFVVWSSLFGSLDLRDS